MSGREKLSGVYPAFGSWSGKAYIMKGLFYTVIKKMCLSEILCCMCKFLKAGSRARLLFVVSASLSYQDFRNMRADLICMSIAFHMSTLVSVGCFVGKDVSSQH